MRRWLHGHHKCWIQKHHESPDVEINHLILKTKLHGTYHVLRGTILSITLWILMTHHELCVIISPILHEPLLLRGLQW